MLIPKKTNERTKIDGVIFYCVILIIITIVKQKSYQAFYRIFYVIFRHIPGPFCHPSIA
jgi:hypothetical protein